MTWLNRVQDAVQSARMQLSPARKRSLIEMLGRIRSDPDAAIQPEATILRELVSEWDNEGWSALEEYALEVLMQGLAARGATLECGSGLTTLLLAVASHRTGHSVLSLEHTRGWAARTRELLAAIEGHHVCLHETTIVNCGECDWYAFPSEPISECYHLVVCDGPPGDMRGGRAGLLPAIQNRLAPGCVILLDDAERDHERALGLAWRDELRAGCELLGSDKHYYRLRLPD